MSSLFLEGFLILLLILANGLLSMAEISVISSRKTRLEQLATEGNTRALSALELFNAPNRFLSTVQIGITLIGILTGAFGGATLAQSLSLHIALVPRLAPMSKPIAFGIVVVAITYLSLILGELVPKRLGLNNPERVAASLAQPMQFLATIAAPVVYLLSMSTESVVKLLGVSQTNREPLITEEEIKVLVRQGTEAGMFEEAEQDMVERVFHLGDQQITALMTPRLEITWLDLNDPFEVNRHKLMNSRHNRFPVCQDTLDNILGILNTTDVLAKCLANEPLDFTALLRQAHFVPETTRSLKVLELFKQSGTHIAFAVDEYGVIQGVVTLNDVMEVIIGDIPLADQQEESPVIQREDGSWLVDGMVAIDRVKSLCELNYLPGEAQGNFQTLGGFVITQLGRIPVSADYFEWSGFRFEVVDMDGNRVDKVLIMPLPTSLL